VADRHAHRDDRAAAEPEHVRVRDLQVIEHGGDVVGRALQRVGTVDRRGVAVALLLDTDDVTCPGEEWDELAEVRLDRRSATVNEHQRHPARPGLAVDLVVHPERTDRGISLSSAHGSGLPIRHRKLPPAEYRARASPSEHGPATGMISSGERSSAQAGRVSPRTNPRTKSARTSDWFSG
jgi:hypothetical protein